MQSGSSQRSLGEFFFSFEWCEKASASRQGQNNENKIFLKDNGKRRHEKQEISEKGKREKRRKRNKEKRWKR